MAKQIISIGLRATQLIFAVIALGLSISAVRWQVYGHTPATTGYVAFASAFGAVAALIGIAAIWIDPLQKLVATAVDALAAVVLLAGGIAVAVGLRGVSCGTFSQNMVSNSLLNGGCTGKGDKTVCGFVTSTDQNRDISVIKGRCVQMEADASFLILGCIVSAVAAVWLFVVARRGSGKANITTV